MVKHFNSYGKTLKQGMSVSQTDRQTVNQSVIQSLNQPLWEIIWCI